MDKTVRMADAAERAIVIVAAVIEGRIDEAGQSFNVQVPEAFTDEVRGSALATIAGAACADLRTSPGMHLVLSPASTTAVSRSRWQGSGKLALPGQAR
jgi:hypothetical protein